MNEDFLHYLWKYKKIEMSNLRTTANEEVTLQSVGSHNTDNHGPDFFNAQIIINGQKWAGNVELHMKSSDWYVHNHEKDKAYDNVILHVVWEDDVEVFRRDSSAIPTLQLKDYLKKELIFKYQKLFNTSDTRWISCEKELSKVSKFVISNWQERLYLERLEYKSIVIQGLLDQSANNWEAVLFKLIAKNFGLKVNGDAFLSMANSFDFSILRKNSDDLGKIEALFFGQAGLLQKDHDNGYVKRLQADYSFLKNKFQLDNRGVLPFQFFRLRPPNFPTIRLAQLAKLYFENQHLFADILQTNAVEEFYKMFKVDTSDFWKNHYTFDKESRWRSKFLTRSFVNLILINTIIPIKFMFARSQGKDPGEEILELITQLPAEKNTIIDKFRTLQMPIENAMNSQAMIELKTKYCDQKACLQCSFGNYLLHGD